VKVIEASNNTRRVILLWNARIIIVSIIARIPVNTNITIAAQKPP
jgi:hypothetical protein